MPGLTTGMDPSQGPRVKDEYDPSEDESYDEATYKPAPQLPQPFVCMRTLVDLIKDLDNDLIDVNPEYQREVVWTADRMTGLIDSLMENFYIPPIILNKKSPADKSKPAVHVCVDGKQRLSSVRAFVKGMIPCHDFRGEKWWFCNTSASGRKKVLPEETQKMFLHKEFVSFEFKDLLSDQEEDLFARVQMGVQLSLAEKMRASTGPWQELARLFVDDFPNVYSLMKDRARAKDFQLTLACFSQLVEVMHPTAADGTPIWKSSYVTLRKLVSNKGAIDDKLKSHFASVWNTFKDLIEMDPDTFTNASSWLRGVQTFAPVEMVAVTVLISMYSETRNKRLLLGDIRGLREAIRENFRDIKMNRAEWLFIWKYLEELEAIRGAVDGTTVHRNLQQSHPAPNTNVPRPPPPAATQAPSAEQRAKFPRPIQGSTALPHQQPIISIKEELGQSSTVRPGPRQNKRRRTDSGPTITPESVVEQPKSVLGNNHASGKQPSQLDVQLVEYAHGQPQYPPMPTHISALPDGNRSSAAASPLVGTAPYQNTNITPYASEQGNHRAPTARMLPVTTVPVSPIQQAPSAPIPASRPPVAASSVPISPMQQPLSAPIPASRPPAAASSVSPLVNGSQSHTRVKISSTRKTSRGAYSPKHTDDQWAGEIRTATPPPNPASSSSSHRHRTDDKPRVTPSQPNIAQYDQVIDLTSDTEEERQYLMSSFKAKTLADREKRLRQNAPSYSARPEAS